MIREVKFESQDRRIKQIIAALNANGIKDIEEANAICEAHGLDPYKTCEETQPICFENAKWAYVVGTAIAIKKGCTNAAEAAEAIGQFRTSAESCLTNGNLIFIHITDYIVSLACLLYFSQILAGIPFINFQHRTFWIGSSRIMIKFSE